MLCTRSLGIFLFIATKLCSINTVNVNNETWTETVLRKNIFKNYDKFLIPTTGDTNINVVFGLFIQNAQVDYEKSQMILSTVIKMNWIDHRLIWKPDEYEQLDYITVNFHEIWYPDIMALFNVGLNVKDNPTNVIITVFKNGSVTWFEPTVQIIVHCQTDIRDWPYDKSTAVLTFGSLMYTVIEMNLTLDHNEVEVENTHSEWEITRVPWERILWESNHYQFIEVSCVIDIKRKVHPYLSIIYVPALCSALFNLITFWLPYDKNYHYKLFAHLFNAMFVAVNIMIVYAKLPIMTSSIPFIVVYYTYSLGLIVITTVITMAVKCMSTSNEPLPQKLTQFLQSRYLGIKINDTTTITICQSNEFNAQNRAHLNNRQKLAEVIDIMCFVLFASIYLILLLRFIS